MHQALLKDKRFMTSIKFLIDENISPRVAEELSSMSYDALHVRDICKGCPDNKIIELARKDNRIIVTLDKDFGEIFSNEVTIILIRSKYQSPDYICEILKKFLKKNRGALESKVKKLIVIRAKGRKD